MAKVTIFYASVSPMAYDVRKFAKMNFDEAVEFFEKDDVGCCTTRFKELSTKVPAEYLFHPEGAEQGDGSDCLFMWVKVENV